MNPHAEIHAMYLRETSAADYANVLEAHLEHGYVASDPECCIFARPVRSNASMKEILDPWRIFREPDCWWIFAAAGDIGRMVKLCPFRLELVGFERHGVVKRYQFERITNLIELWSTNDCPILSHPSHPVKTTTA